jgi:hypothetical protein
MHGCGQHVAQKMVWTSVPAEQAVQPIQDKGIDELCHRGLIPAAWPLALPTCYLGAQASKTRFCSITSALKQPSERIA